jgi:hypothetical protein
MGKVVSLSLAAALSVSYASASSDLAAIKAELDALRSKVATLEAQLKKSSSVKLEKKFSSLEKRFNNSANAKLEKKVSSLAKTVQKVKAHDAGDNIKWDVDFRTSVDKITYKMADGSERTNDALLTNRLWLGMKYAPSENMVFYGRLSYLKAYGSGTQGTQRSDGSGNANFDWVTNENAQEDNQLNVKQAYWLYMNDQFLGADMPWTASVGRRPSTDGLLANFREDQDRQSALGHTVNVEFDGASFKWDLNKVTPLPGSWVKLCMGRGVTNAKQRFNGADADYSTDETEHFDSDMAGLIFVPYDDGQYSLHTNYAKATNMIGNLNRTNAMYNNGQFYDFGNMSWWTAAFVANGIGDEISDFLDETKLFVSYAESKTDPDTSVGGEYMLGSSESQKGHSYWIGAQFPALVTDDGRFGIEWNKGSKYWRSMTYGEDTMVGSKIGARGTAWEAYYHQPITKGLTASLRYTKIDYDYSGSNGFFGSAAAPLKITSDMMGAGNYVSESEDIRAYLRYRY